MNPSRYHAEFAADLSADEAAFELRSQMFTAATVFNTPITNPAWKLKPSWYMVAQADRIISPDLERMYATRAQSHTVEIAGASHSVYRSHLWAATVPGSSTTPCAGSHRKDAGRSRT